MRTDAVQKIKNNSKRKNINNPDNHRIVRISQAKREHRNINPKNTHSKIKKILYKIMHLHFFTP